ncbi:MAG: 50S ribosomal protein L9 [Nitrospinota bacterium]
MLVILKETTRHLGERGNEVNVADGYARNYLIPKKIALKATPGNRIAFQNELKQTSKKYAKIKGEAASLAEKIEKLRLVFTKRAGEEDKLFGSVTTQEISENLLESGITIDKKKLEVASPIKTVGNHVVRAKLHPDVYADIHVEVKKEIEKGEAEESAETAKTAQEESEQE